MLLSLDVDVCFRPKIHEKLVIIDECIFYDGSLNTLSQSETSERMNRWESREMVREAIAKHKLDTCDHCLAMRLGANNIDHLRLSFIQHRQALGLTKKDLASLSGVARSTIANFELGKSTINLITLDRLCAAMHLVVRSLPKFMIPSLDRQLQNAEFKKSSVPTRDSLEILQWTIGQRRESLLMTQRELAAKTGLTQKTISSFELSKSALDFDTHEHLCNKLDLATRFIPASLAADFDASLFEFWTREFQESDAYYEKVKDFVRTMRLARTERPSTRSKVGSVFGVV